MSNWQYKTLKYLNEQFCCPLVYYKSTAKCPSRLENATDYDEMNILGSLCPRRQEQSRQGGNKLIC